MMTIDKACPLGDTKTPADQPSRETPVKNWFWKQARKIVVLVVGLTVTLIGLAGLLLPVLPGWLLIFVGLFILGTEFAWAKWVLKEAKKRAGHIMNAAKNQLSPQQDPPEKDRSTS